MSLNQDEQNLETMLEDCMAMARIELTPQKTIIEGCMATREEPDEYSSILAHINEKDSVCEIYFDFLQDGRLHSMESNGLIFGLQEIDTSFLRPKISRILQGRKMSAVAYTWPDLILHYYRLEYATCNPELDRIQDVETKIFIKIKHDILSLQKILLLKIDHDVAEERKCLKMKHEGLMGVAKDTHPHLCPVSFTSRGKSVFYGVATVRDTDFDERYER
jgi:hypothetical protein